jgi:hypothetical protein
MAVVVAFEELPARLGVRLVAVDVDHRVGHDVLTAVRRPRGAGDVPGQVGVPPLAVQSGAGAGVDDIEDPVGGEGVDPGRVGRVEAAPVLGEQDPDGGLVDQPVERVVPRRCPVVAQRPNP